MAKAFAYSILTALLIAVHSTTAFPSDIHYKMTKPEKLAIFGSEDPDPEYDVFPMSLPGMRHLREINKAIKCTLNLNGEEINLNLKPVAQYLATRYIPVWSAYSDQHAYKTINYKPLTTAMSGIGEFTMYQDAEKAASLIVYTDRIEKIVVEGFITSRYAIRSLPKRLTGELLNEIDDITEIPNMMGGAIESNKDTGFYAVITNPETSVPATVDTSLESDESIESIERQSDGSHEGEATNPAHVSKSPEQHEIAEPNEPIIDERRGGGKSAPTVQTPLENHDFIYPTESRIGGQLTAIDEHDERKKRYAQTTLYPEMLIVLDHNAIRHRTMTQALRVTLAFWNAVDLIYRTLDDPKIRLNIAGMIIAADDTATPYIAKDTSVAGIGDLGRVSSKMRAYFYKERVRFPINQYDIIIAMTTMNLCEGAIDSCDSSDVHGYVNGLSVCSSGHNVTGTKTLRNTMIIHSDGMFGPEHSFFAQFEPTYAKNACSREDCSDKLHPVFLLGSKKTECLRNKPLSIKPVDEVLPGRWLSMDGQCLNEGYAGSCHYKRNIGKCAVKGCKAKNSEKCVRSEKVPLPGSKCGIAKYCNKAKKCVHRL